jgi:hypothetical protein
LQRRSLLSKNKCPHKSCDRHRKGFTRPWNLKDHIQRRHEGSSRNRAIKITSSKDFEGTDESDDGSNSEGSAEAIGNRTGSKSWTPNQEESLTKIHQDIKFELAALQAKYEDIDKQVGGLKEMIENWTKTTCKSNTLGDKHLQDGARFD